MFIPLRLETMAIFTFCKLEAVLNSKLAERIDHLAATLEQPVALSYVLRQPTPSSFSPAAISVQRTYVRTYMLAIEYTCVQWPLSS